MTVSRTLSATESDGHGDWDAAKPDWDLLRLVPPKREAALALIGQRAQRQDDIVELLDEAALISAAALQADIFLSGKLDAQREAISMRARKLQERNGSHPRLTDLRLREDRSALAFALASGHPVMIKDLTAEPRFTDARLVQEGARSGVVCSVCYGDKRYGALGVLSAEPHSVSEADALFLQSVCLLLGPSIANHTAEKALQTQTQLFTSTLDALDSMVLLLDEDGDILDINSACRSVGGFELDEILHRSFCGAFLLPEEISLVHDSLARLRDGEPHPKCETFLLTKHGERRRIAWSFSRLPSEPERGLAMIASGIDITEQHETVERLAAMELEFQRESNGGAARREQTGRSPRADVARVHEKRAVPRRPYPCVQAVGPCYDNQLPRLDQFQDVRCRDISPRGFSFITREIPDFQELVVTFGKSPTRLFLRARVVHVSPFCHEGVDCLLVGCQYLGRVELSGSDIRREP